MIAIRMSTTLTAFLVVLGPGPLAWADKNPTGTLVAKVTMTGERPARPPINMSADAYCPKANVGTNGAGKQVLAQNAVVDDGGNVRNVIVYVKDGLDESGYEPPADKALLDQRGCMYHPHVMTVMVGQQVTVRNSDDTMHNIHSMARRQRAFNFAQPRKGMERDVTFKRPEIVKIKCDVHPWMLAYVGVFQHPFHAVTDTGGTLRIEKLPPGEYTLAAWHEMFGELEQKVTIKPGEQTAVTFAFHRDKAEK